MLQFRLFIINNNNKKKHLKKRKPVPNQRNDPICLYEYIVMGTL